MTDPTRTQDLLARAQRGDSDASEGLFEVVYAELRRLAHGYLSRERAGQTLQTTALVHEAYLRLVQVEDSDWKDRSHFFVTAARAMRRILVDRARARRVRKKGESSPEAETALDELAARYEDSIDLIDLHDALERLAGFDKERAKLVELRYFGGLTIEELAPLLGLSRATVERRWATARAWLKDAVGGSEIDP